jgi:hypothetical protein
VTAAILRARLRTIGRMRTCHILLLVGSLGCGSEAAMTPSSDAGLLDRVTADGTVDVATHVDSSRDSMTEASTDGGAPTDAAAEEREPTATVACGNVECGLNDAGERLYCCTSDQGVTGTCEFATACSGGGDFYCGGAENCVVGALCCLIPGATQCVPGGCSTYPVVCHTSDECDGGVCCPLANGSSFSTCGSGPCP